MCLYYRQPYAALRKRNAFVHMQQRAVPLNLNLTLNLVCQNLKSRPATFRQKATTPPRTSDILPVEELLILNIDNTLSLYFTNHAACEYLPPSDT